MVTTRSADKQAGALEKEDTLALRSRSEETRQSDFHPHSEPTAAGSSKTRSKILVNVPPSRKRSRASYDGTDDTGNTILQSENALIKAPAEQTIDGRTEIPDSQESPLKSTVTLNPQQQLEISLLTHVESLSGPPSALERVQESTDGLPQATSPSKPDYLDMFTDDADYGQVTSERRHQRFGSEDLFKNKDVKPSDDDDVVPEHAVAALSDNDDDDDAPEIATSKKATKGVSHSQRKPRVRKPLVKAQLSDTMGSLPIGMTGDANASEIHEEEIATSNTTPSLKIDVSQIDNSMNMLASDDSGDSAFVTARTTRHVDVFATPIASKAHVRSPMIRNTITKLDEIDEEVKMPAERPTTKLSAGLSAMNATTAQPVPDHRMRRSAILPRKANNTLENYRRQALQNRATKSTTKDRRTNFRLTDDWPAKRRKFVVGY